MSFPHLTTWRVAREMVLNVINATQNTPRTAEWAAWSHFFFFYILSRQEMMNDTQSLILCNRALRTNQPELSGLRLFFLINEKCPFYR